MSSSGTQKEGTMFPFLVPNEKSRLGASGSGWCRCSYTAAFFRSEPSVFSVSHYRCGSRRFDSPHALPFVIRGNGQNADRQRLSFCEVVCIIYVVFKWVFAVRVTLISPAEFRFVSTEFAVKSDQHSGCFPRDAPRRFFEVLFLGHTFIVSGRFPEVPVFRGFRSAY